MQRLIVQVGQPVHGGACLARDATGKPVFVTGSLPGETVEVQITAVHKTYSWARTTKVLDSHRLRFDSVWPEVRKLGVGGMDLAHARPTLQREMKSEVLADQLRRIGGQSLFDQVSALGPNVFQVQPVPGDEAEDDLLLGRRSRVQLTADSRGKLGMRKFRSKEVVPLSSLPIAHPRIQELEPWDDQRWKGEWRPGQRVEFAAPSGGPVTIGHGSSLLVAEATAGEAAFVEKGHKNRTGSPGDSRQYKSQWHVESEGVTETFLVTPGGFWQTHVAAPDLLVREVLRGSVPEPGQTIMELYSGAGLLTKFLAAKVQPGGQVVSLEGSPQAVEDAADSLGDLVDQGNVSLYQGRVDAGSVQELDREVQNVDTVVLDPPRSGAGEQVVRAIAETKATRVVLVSCDVAAGARDLRDFVGQGFSVEHLSAWDLFPHTHHFEIVSVLIR